MNKSGNICTWSCESDESAERKTLVITSTITDKDAMILYDKKGFKIIIKQMCIAKGYQENKLYWLDISEASLNTHSGGVATTLHTWHQHSKVH